MDQKVEQYLLQLLGVTVKPARGSSCFLLIHSANPQSRPGSFYSHMLSVRPSPLFKSRKTKQQKTMFATGVTVGLAVWIILFLLSLNKTLFIHSQILPNAAKWKISGHISRFSYFFYPKKTTTPTRKRHFPATLHLTLTRLFDVNKRAVTAHIYRFLQGIIFGHTMPIFSLFLIGHILT